MDSGETADRRRGPGCGLERAMLRAMSGIAESYANSYVLRVQLLGLSCLMFLQSFSSKRRELSGRIRYCPVEIFFVCQFGEQPGREQILLGFRTICHFGERL